MIIDQTTADHDIAHGAKVRRWAEREFVQFVQGGTAAYCVLLVATVLLVLLALSIQTFQ